MGLTNRVNPKSEKEKDEKNLQSIILAAPTTKKNRRRF
jgi:hypothetical protein